MSLKGVPYWRLSSFYFFYFALVGTVVPYLGLYLQHLHFSAAQIGSIAAIMMVTRVVAPMLWGWLSDLTGRRLGVIRLGSLCACISFVGMLWQTEFFWLAMIIACYSFFWNAVLAQYEVITLGFLQGVTHFYSRIRLWGSIGFIVSVVSLGYWFDWRSVADLPVVAMLLLLSIWFSSLTIREPRPLCKSKQADVGVWQVLRSRSLQSFLLASFLLQLSFGSYYTFYSVYLESLSYPQGTIGVLWGLGVLAEVLVFWIMHQLIRRFSLRRLMLATLAFTVLRWCLIGGYAQSLGVLVFAQLLHAFSFGTAHAVSIEWVRRFFRGPVQGQGQALYSAASFGAGGALGALISGWVWDTSPMLSFAISAVAAALAWWLVWWGMRDQPDIQ